ncbi:MAG: hypothetical protein JXA69_00750 [Phycisphaerae bacterium]|nr:hypothetical protein [Phycisphaerae bacterium]
MRFPICSTLIVAILAVPTHAVTFRSAKPVWPTGREKEINVFVGFRAAIDAPADEKVTLRLTASCLYRATLNGQFIGHGPARGPHGWFRVDEWDLTNQLASGRNVVAVEVAGYNTNSYYLLDQPSFLQAEVLAGGHVLASTAGDGAVFDARILEHRLQKVQRYSFQRPASEVYSLRPGFDQWREDPSAAGEPAACTVQPPVKLLPRRIGYPTFECRPVVWDVAAGELAAGQPVENPWKDRSLVHIGPKLKGYPENELTVIPSIELQAVANASRTDADTPAAGRYGLGANRYAIVDFGVNRTGFVGATVTCRAKTRLFLTFDEILSDGDVNFKRLGCVNILAFELEPGTYAVESFEPYTMRYAKLMVLEGACDVENVYLREYINPDIWGAHFAASDERLNRLFAAARETFAQNGADLFMDCPSRERAGWLCDSFFTARVAKDFNHDLSLETNFIENFLLPERFEHLPEGMLPMCYPADHNDGVFIPNWALWFIVQLEEYAVRGGDRAMVDALRPRVMKLFDYFKPFHNDDGLLEKLESWVFVEWSNAAHFVQDVNYPTNMLYAGALSAAGRLYNRPDLVEQADAIRETIRKQSFDGTFFVDNAERKEGKLTRTANRSEVCQYYAFFFKIVTPETHGALWKRLCEEFGPQRKQTKAHPDIHQANQFIGNVLRLELLSRYGLVQQLLEESAGYNLFMADRTGTLWENDGPYASCNHGFASMVAHVLYRDVLGIFEIDDPNRVVRLRFADADLAWCEGRLPTPTGAVTLRWWKDGEGLAYRLEVPFGYRAEVTNASGKRLSHRP